GARLIMTSLQPLEEAVASVQSLAMPKKLRIVVNSPLAVTKLRHVLGEPNGSGAKVTLCAVIEDSRQAELTLPGQYMLTPNVLMQIPTLDGVVESVEAA